MDLTQAIDLYCERTAMGLWQEPLNLVSNACFLLAAVLGLRQARDLGAQEKRPVLLLCGLLASIGIGSGLFHSFATLWAQTLDVVPIGLYIVATLYVWLRDAHGDSFSQRMATLGMLVFLSALSSAVVPAELVNGSQGYFGVLVIMGWLAWRGRRSGVGGRAFARATGLFTVSLVFRTIDQELCPVWSLGTHFMWHVCNAVVCYLPLRAYISVRRNKPWLHAPQARPT